MKRTSAKWHKLDTTGVYAVCCRHTLVHPSGVIDFTAGEGYVCFLCPKRLPTPHFRFRFVDVAVSTVMQRALEHELDIIFSYDIACKYSINFAKRVTEGDSPLLSYSADRLDKDITWLIGKFHLGAHKPECSEKYSFNYTWGVGRMSGELVETIWADFNFFRHQTKEMTPAARKDTLSDGFNQWNWNKIIQIGML